MSFDRHGAERGRQCGAQRALHVSLPTVYTAIDSREALVERLLDRLVDEIAGDVALGDGEVVIDLDAEMDADVDADLNGSGGEVNGCAPVARSAVVVDDDLLRRGRALLDWSLLGATPTPRAKHVNIHPGVLHVWHCLDGDVTPDFTANGDTI